jgi:hypothetical protein
MGSFNISCGLSGYPINKYEKLIFIPILLKHKHASNVYVYDNVYLIPLCFNGTYNDYGTVKLADNQENESGFKLLSSLLSQMNPNIYIETFNWDQFFNLCHSKKIHFDEGTLSFVAFEEKAFDYVINNFTLYYYNKDTEESDYFGYSYFKNELINKLNSNNEQISAFIQNNESKNKDVVYDCKLESMKIEAVRSIFTGKELNFNYRAFINQSYEKFLEHFENVSKIFFINEFLDSINKPWQESMCVNLDFDTKGIKVLRNILMNNLNNEILLFEDSKDSTDIEFETLSNKFFENLKNIED